MTNKLFTKSAFKISLECPWKLYYYYNSDIYANANEGNDFLEALLRYCELDTMSMVFIWDYFKNEGYRLFHRFFSYLQNQNHKL